MLARARISFGLYFKEWRGVIAPVKDGVKHIKRIGRINLQLGEIRRLSGRARRDDWYSGH
jgi:hypothetical protein